MTADDQTTPTADLLAAWDAFDLFDYADDSEGLAALVTIVEPMIERLRAATTVLWEGETLPARLSSTPSGSFEDQSSTLRIDRLVDLPPGTHVVVTRSEP